MDPSHISTEALLAATRRAANGHAANLSESQFLKIAEIAAQRSAQIVLQHQQQTSAVERQKLSRVNDAIQTTTGIIDQISTIEKLSYAHETGAQLDPEIVKALPQLQQMAGHLKQSLGEAVAEGDMAEQQLEALIEEAAAQDPEAVAAVANEIGDALTPEQAEELVEALAAELDIENAGGPEALPEPEMKESQVRRARLQQFAKTSQPRTVGVVALRAELVLEAVYAQAQAQGQ